VCVMRKDDVAARFRKKRYVGDDGVMVISDEDIALQVR
jgi:hypothetical protein